MHHALTEKPGGSTTGALTRMFSTCVDRRHSYTPAATREKISLILVATVGGEAGKAVVVAVSIVVVAAVGGAAVVVEVVVTAVEALVLVGYLYGCMYNRIPYC